MLYDSVFGEFKKKSEFNKQIKEEFDNLQNFSDKFTENVISSIQKSTSIVLNLIAKQIKEKGYSQKTLNDLNIERYYVANLSRIIQDYWKQILIYGQTVGQQSISSFFSRSLNSVDFTGVDLAEFETVEEKRKRIDSNKLQEVRLTKSEVNRLRSEDRDVPLEESNFARVYLSRRADTISNNIARDTKNYINEIVKGYFTSTDYTRGLPDYQVQQKGDLKALRREYLNNRLQAPEEPLPFPFNEVFPPADPNVPRTNILAEAWNREYPIDLEVQNLPATKSNKSVRDLYQDLEDLLLPSKGIERLQDTADYRKYGKGLGKNLENELTRLQDLQNEGQLDENDAKRFRLAKKLRDLRRSQDRGVWKPGRIGRLARTELGAAYNLGRLEAYLNNGIQYVRWDVDPEHFARGVVCELCNYRSKFNGGIYPITEILNDPRLHLPVHPYCLCVLRPLNDTQAETGLLTKIGKIFQKGLDNNVLKWMLGGMSDGVLERYVVQREKKDDDKNLYLAIGLPVLAMGALFAAYIIYRKGRGELAIDIPAPRRPIDPSGGSAVSRTINDVIEDRLPLVDLPDRPTPLPELYPRESALPDLEIPVARVEPRRLELQNIRLKNPVQGQSQRSTLTIENIDTDEFINVIDNLKKKNNTVEEALGSLFEDYPIGNNFNNPQEVIQYLNVLIRDPEIFRTATPQQLADLLTATQEARNVVVSRVQNYRPRLQTYLDDLNIAVNDLSSYVRDVNPDVYKQYNPNDIREALKNNSLLEQLRAYDVNMSASQILLDERALNEQYSRLLGSIRRYAPDKVNDIEEIINRNRIVKANRDGQILQPSVRLNNTESIDPVDLTEYRGFVRKLRGFIDDGSKIDRGTYEGLQSELFSIKNQIDKRLNYIKRRDVAINNIINDPQSNPGNQLIARRLFEEKDQLNTALEEINQLDKDLMSSRKGRYRETNNDLGALIDKEGKRLGRNDAVRARRSLLEILDRLVISRSTNYSRMLNSLDIREKNAVLWAINNITRDKNTPWSTIESLDSVDDFKELIRRARTEINTQIDNLTNREFKTLYETIQFTVPNYIHPKYINQYRKLRS
jgi:hypothetical protein